MQIPRKPISLTFGLMLVVGAAFGQKVQLEVYSGISFSNFSGAQEFSGKNYVPVGLNVDVNITRYFNIEAGVMYSTKGSNMTTSWGCPVFLPPGQGCLIATGVAAGATSGSSTVAVPTQTNSLAVNYLDIPLMLVFAPSDIRFFVGPQLSFLSGAQLNEEDVSDRFESTDFGIRYGIGYDYRRLTIRAMGQHGFTDICKDSYYDWSTQSYLVTVGIVLIKMRRHDSGSDVNDIVPARRKIE